MEKISYAKESETIYMIEAKRQVCQLDVTLDGESARIQGARLDFPSVVSLESGKSFQYSWETVFRKIKSGQLNFIS